jgi:hypothetical protein
MCCSILLLLVMPDMMPKVRCSFCAVSGPLKPSSPRSDGIFVCFASCSRSQSVCSLTSFPLTQPQLPANDCTRCCAQCSLSASASSQQAPSDGADAFCLLPRFVLANLGQLVAAACVYIASKLEGTPRKTRDVITCGFYLLCGQVIKLDNTYWTLKDRLVETEQSVLACVNFELRIAQPHSMLLNFTKLLAVEEKLANVAWAVLNDSVITDAWLHLDEATLALGALLVASKIAQHALPLRESECACFGTSADKLQGHSYFYLYC